MMRITAGSLPPHRDALSVPAIVILLTFAIATACGRNGEKPPTASTAAPSAETTEIAQLKATTAEKDSLLQDLMATSRFVNEINTELGKVRRVRADRPVRVRNEDGTLISAAAYRAEILTRIRDLTARLEDSERRLELSRTRAEAMPQRDAGLLSQIAEYQQTLKEYRDIVEDQKREIAQLNAQVGELKADRQRLTATNAALGHSVASLVETDNTVFWIAGSKKELLRKQVVTEEGGSRSLLIVRRGATLTPSREISEEHFIAVNRRQTRDIPLPKPDTWYRVVSRQRLDYLDGVSKGRIKGSVQVRDPERFWAVSKYLILVEDN